MKFFRKLLVLSLIFLVLTVFVGWSLNRRLPVNLISPIPTPVPTFFSFAVMSDIHSDISALQKALNKVKEDKIDFMIIAGDLTTLGKPQEFQKVKKVLDDNKIPYYTLPGNHDLWSTKSQTNSYREIFGADFQTFRIGAVKFILINNGDGLLGVEGIVGADGQNQGEWIKKELEDCPKLFCLVFAHMPLNHPFMEHVMGEDNEGVALQAARLVKEFNEAKIKELFAGHVHYLATYTIDGLKTTTDGAIYTDTGKVSSRFVEVTIHLPELEMEQKEIWLE